jgi:hypothetical protein
MSEIKVNKISPRTACGTTTLGDSGDTFTIPAGVTITNNGTQTGFGRTGTVNWNTTKITADPGPAVSGVGYFTDTSSSAFNVTLPSSPSAGDIVAVADYANTWDSNAITIVRNGSNIEGDADNFVCNTEGSSITFVYVDATKGWVVVNSGNSDQAGKPLFIDASGGTITESGNCRIHTFTAPGSFTVNAIAALCGPTRNNISYLVVAGGGSGGRTSVSGGGGGAGGYREFKAPLTPYTASPLDGNPGGTSITIAAGTYPVTIGAGGAGDCGPCAVGNDGSNSIFSTITSTGGGGGGAYANGRSGGSGGGAGGADPTRSGGTGNTPPVTPAQGKDGGPAGGNPSNYANTGGGGGATANGEPITGNFPGGGPGGNGGAGATSSISGTPTGRAGGGGGAADNRSSSRTGGDASDGGGQGGDTTRSSADGTANTGGGGGGAHGPAQPNNQTGSKSGGSGIVIIRYKYQ